MEYSAAVRQRFERAVAAVAAEGTSSATGTAEDRSLGVWVGFTVTLADGVIRRASYRVFGCPHLIAACEWTAEWLTGRERAALRSLPLDALAAELELPRAKFGKLLRLEDALAACDGELERQRESNGGE